MTDKVYLVSNPPLIRGIYDTWAECKAAVTGVRGARFMAVASREKAEAMLNGSGVILPSGIWAFSDGNAAGGVGVVLVEQGSEGSLSVSEASITVDEVFRDAGLRRLGSGAEISDALTSLRNVLAELAGAYYVITHAEPGSRFTIVHDYVGVANWIEGRWKMESPIVAAIVEACQRLVRERGLTVAFRHQAGHQSTWAGGDEFARWNGRADELATAATAPAP